jgi:hypothetical protein
MGNAHVRLLAREMDRVINAVLKLPERYVRSLRDRHRSSPRVFESSASRRDYLGVQRRMAAVSKGLAL